MTDLPSFDELKELAENDPQALEDLRIRMSEELIENAPESSRPQLRAQLSHINLVIESGSNPNHVNILLGKELAEQFARFHTALNAPETLNDRTADIIPIKKDD